MQSTPTEQAAQSVPELKQSFRSLHLSGHLDLGEVLLGLLGVGLHGLRAHSRGGQAGATVRVGGRCVCTRVCAHGTDGFMHTTRTCLRPQVFQPAQTGYSLEAAARPALLTLSPGFQPAGHTSSGWLCTYWMACSTRLVSSTERPKARLLMVECCVHGKRESGWSEGEPKT